MMTSMSRRPFLSPALAIMMLSSTVSLSTALADGLPITPGLWEVKMHNAMLGTENVERRCMREPEFDPAVALSALGPQQGCSISNEVITGNMMEYDVVCKNDQMPDAVTGHFSVTIDGDQGSGNVDMSLGRFGNLMSMRMTLAAARIGDC